jgi:plasmid maintenance system antidote protein VapI
MTKREKPNKFYVYVHRRCDNKEVFYVGKGCGNRANDVKQRNVWWKRVYEKCGRIVEYVEKGLSEDDAYDLEVETIKFYRECGIKLCNLTIGGVTEVEGYTPLNRNPEKYDFVFKDTGQTFSCTQNELVENYGLTRPEASRLVSGERGAQGIALASVYFKPPPTYEFLVIATGEVFNLTVDDASNLFNVSRVGLKRMINGTSLTYKGITIKGVNYRKARNVELCVIETGEIFTATYKEMYELYGVPKSSFTNLVNGKLLTTHGYCLASTYSEVLKRRNEKAAWLLYRAS